MFRLDGMLEAAWLLGLGSLGLLARIREREVQATQDVILRAIRAQPGIRLAELQASLDVGWRSLYVYLGRLEEAGLVKVKRQGNRTVVYPAGAKIPRRPPAAELTEQARKVALYMVMHPGLDASDYQHRLALSRRMAHYYVQRFVRNGLFKSQEKDRYVGLEPTAKVLKLLGLDQ